MFLNSKPMRYLVTRVARAYGFMDPIALLASLRRFARPSEVAEPIELLRAGMLFHARGLVNTKAIQHNLDWVWPFWVEKQFNPADPSFIPRAFSFSHINMTHRDWTAVGVPDVPFYPIVDPRGLVTPIFDGWSLDFWFVPDNGPLLLPSKLGKEFEQEYLFDDNLRVVSRAVRDRVTLRSDVSLRLNAGEPLCCMRIEVESGVPGALAVALRPYNPEGVSFIESVEVDAEGGGWKVNDVHPIRFSRPAARHFLSTYERGDASLHLQEHSTERKVKCPACMATAVALFPLGGPGRVSLDVTAPIYDELELKRRPTFGATESWPDAMHRLAKLRVADPLIQRLYDQALRGVVLHTPGEVYPGPYTYKRFWFRDAAFVLNALLTLGGVRRTRRALAEFAPRQRRDGYFLSQEGEWDSNGEALWILHRFATLSGEELPEPWLESVARGARWIQRKRIPMQPRRPESGLFPAGFSAEHLGPNDYYYWDDFWGVAGLRGAAQLLRDTDPSFAGACAKEADEFLEVIRRSFPSGPERRFPGAIPASPFRRMDSGAIGSIVADYPLQLFPPGDPWISATADYLCTHSSHRGGFFQNMIHSGINAYLTLHLAQVRMRAGDAKAAWELIDTVARLASPTGQWPEANHPQTGGGCMGDGQHIWAAAEWLMMIRNCFVREESEGLVIGAGVRPEWLDASGRASFGPTLTPYGSVTTRFERQPGGMSVSVDGDWRGEPPALLLAVPGCIQRNLTAGPAGQSAQLLETAR